MTEKTHTNHGKWSEAGVPHRGWECVSVEDLGEPTQTCEMCESADIRYAHVMQHPDYSEMLAVGCVCAERMEEDYVRPRQREKGLKSIARRRASWVRREWRMSRQGNPYLNAEGFNLTVLRQRDRDDSYWSVRVENRASSTSQIGRKRHSSEAAAKAAALEALIWAKSHLG